MSSSLFARTIAPLARTDARDDLSLRGVVELHLQVASEREPRQLLQRACETLRRLLGADYAVLGLATGGDAERRLLGCGLDPAVEAALPSRWTPWGPLAAVLAARAPVREAAIPTDEFGLPPGLPDRSAHLAIAVRAHGEAVAWVCFSGTLHPEGFSHEAELVASSAAALLGRACEALGDDCIQTLADAIPEVFWSVQVEPFALLYVSPAYERMWGRTLESIARTPTSWMDAVVPEDRAAVTQAFSDQMRGVGRLDHEYRIQRPDGTVRWIWDRGFPVRSRDGRVRRITGIAIDVTDRKALEEQLRYAQKMEAVGRLAGGVAHDFNNLLGVIMGCSEGALRILPPDHPARARLEQALGATERAAGVARQLMAFSRRKAAVPRIIDVDHLLSDMDGMLRTVMSENITLEHTPASQLGRIKADPGEIEQVVMNLAVNARDAMPRGGRLTLGTRNVDRDDAGRTGPYVLLEVEDDGTGIPADVEARIFEPFFTTKEEGKGTGLGLSTVYRIVEEAGGHIFVHSVAGEGTRFRLFFPRVDAGPAPVRPTTQRVLPRGTERVLLAEDDDVLRTVLAETLETAGYSVLTATDGPSALHVARGCAETIDLLITDVVMPGADGRAVAEQLTQERPGLPVLYISGYTPPTISAFAIPVGAAFLAKPFGAVELTRQVREMLDARTAALPVH